MNSDQIIFISAGEASGDNISAKLINAIKQKNNNIKFVGIAGSKMIEAGMESIFPYDELSIMGFVEILPRIPKILYRLHQTIKYIKKVKPIVLVTIDSPGFNFLLARKIKKLNLNIKLIHYIAPTVWAYRPERAKKIAKIFDHLIVILPFEPKYFRCKDLATTYIGHPIIEDLSKFKPPVTNSNIKSILILPGSRECEVKRLLPIFIQSLKIIQNELVNFKVIVSSLGHLKPIIDSLMKKTNFDYEIIDNDSKKFEVYPTIDFAICKSGTVSLEIAMAKIPMIVTYKINPISAYFLRKILTTKYVNLINILAGKEIITELLQKDCTAENIASEALKIIVNKSCRDYQISEAYKIIEALGVGDKMTPSEKAADIVINLTKQ